MKIIHVPESVEPEGKSIFLAGPTPRHPSVPSWRPQAIELFEKNDFNGTLFTPEGRTETWCRNYEQQIDWETAALEAADVIMFWVPRDMATMPALTTNDEFGYWRAKAPGKILFGAPENAAKVGYQLLKCWQLKIPTSMHLDQLVRWSIVHGDKDEAVPSPDAGPGC